MPETIWTIVIVLLILLTFISFKLTPSMFILSAYIALKMNEKEYIFQEQVLTFIILGIIFTIVLKPAIKYIYYKIVEIIKKYNKNKKKTKKSQKNNKKR